MKTILCYGDSHTWGFVPGSLIPNPFYVERYAREDRWTGILQNTLGADYYIIEEGLNGRTTNLDDDITVVPEKNGKDFLLTALYSHAPLDLVVFMLGINDLKVEFNRTSVDVANGVKELLQIIKKCTFGPDMQSPPKILLINPPTFLHENCFDGVFVGAIERGRGLGDHLEKLAEEYECSYFDASLHVQASEDDGVHFDKKGHKLFAALIQNEIKKILQEVSK